MSGNALNGAGFFGKLPMRGDFVERRLPSEFVAPWDSWLQQCVAESQRQLAGDWLKLYLTGPLWAFATAPGILGPSSWVGMLMPSVDKVGRYFPLTAAIEAGPRADPVSLLSASQSWLERLEDALLSVLDDPAPTLELFDTRVGALALELEPTEQLQWPTAQDGAPAQQLRMPGTRATAIAGTLVTERLGAYSAWSTSGAEAVPASSLLCAGLPTPTSFAAMLNGAWGPHGWLTG